MRHHVINIRVLPPVATSTKELDRQAGKRLHKAFAMSACCRLPCMCGDSRRSAAARLVTQTRARMRQLHMQPVREDQYCCSRPNKVDVARQDGCMCMPDTAPWCQERWRTEAMTRATSVLCRGEKSMRGPYRLCTRRIVYSRLAGATACR
jgi:hypothetical protein